MKLIILAAVIASTCAAKLNRAYLPPNFARTSGGSSEFLQTPILSPSDSNFNNQRNDFRGSEINYANEGRFIEPENHRINSYENFERSERLRAALDRNAAILRQTNENNGETYSYSFETENGIVAEENGDATNGVEAQGGYSYTGDDGQVYSVRYTAGQNGFVPEGDHLPTPPPIPEEILKALEQNARDEAAGIFDDGSYRDEKYASGNSAYQTNFGQNLNNNANINDDSIVVNSISNSGFQQDSRLSSRFDQTDNGVTKAYLPPTVRRPVLNRRPSFSPRSGYQY